MLQLHDVAPSTGLARQHHFPTFNHMQRLVLPIVGATKKVDDSHRVSL